MRLRAVHAANLVVLIWVARASGVPWGWALSPLWVPLAAAATLLLGLVAWSALVVFWIRE